MSFRKEKVDLSLHTIVVLESYDIRWLGIQQMIRTAMGNSVSLIRISDTRRLADAVARYQPDAVLLSAIGHHTGVLLLLQQLSLMILTGKTVHISAYLRKELPHLANLLLAFGVSSVIREPVDATAFIRYLVPDKKAFQPARLTLQERNVAQALLTGQSVTRVAQLMHRDVRTISAHAQSLLGKLNMTNRGELQVLGGQLLAEEIPG